MKKYLLLLGFAAIANVGFAQSSAGDCVSGDCMNGYGTFRFNGDVGVYIGQFKNGKQQGQGTFVFPSGEKYEGGWVNGSQTGLATFYWADGRSQKGDWKDGELVRVIDDMEVPPVNSTPPVTEKQPVVVANNTPPKQTVVTPPKQTTTPPKQTTTQVKLNGSAAIASSEGPSISIIAPQVTRGFVVNSAVEKIDVIGTANDKDGVRQVRVNGMVAWLAAPNKTKTNFQIPVSLVLGQNKIWIEAEDLAGKVNKEEFTIDFSKPTSQPIASGDKPKNAVKVDARSSSAVKGSLFKTALIIGNSKYSGAMLRNAMNDADSLAGELRRQGWEVKSYTDLEQEQMESVIHEFGGRLKEKGGAGFFYYAGHGVQLEGNNYLIPVKAPIKKQADVKYKAVNLGTVLDEMNEAGNKMNILVLDACRNNPFAESRSLKGEGLAAVDNAPVGTFIAYATAPGKAASDGDGNNGLYTQELLKAMRVKGLTIEEVFKKVRKNVRQLSGGQQIPWDSSSLEDVYYFQKKEVAQKK
jgi:Caspase domain/MORN repeat